MTFAERLQGEWIRGGPLSTALLPLTWLYGGLLRIRAALYRHGTLRAETLPVPVIIVGNWIVGGAGKTPTTLALLGLLKQRGIHAGVISRGYGRDDEQELHLATRRSSPRQVGDEPLLIHLRSGAPVAVGRDRVAAARALLHTHPELQVLISDDGLQHLRLPRALSILVFDERGIGNGRVLPSGPLRQPPAAALAPDELVLYNAAQASTPLPGFLARRRLSGAVSLADWWEGSAATPEALATLRGKRVLAAAGLAQPQRFFAMLRDQGLTVDELPLPDHHDFTTLPWPADTPDVLITEKDAVKLPPERIGHTRVWVVALDFEPEQAFTQALEAHLARLLP